MIQRKFSIPVIILLVFCFLHNISCSQTMPNYPIYVVDARRQEEADIQQYTWLKLKEECFNERAPIKSGQPIGKGKPERSPPYSHPYPQESVDAVKITIYTLSGFVTIVVPVVLATRHITQKAARTAAKFEVQDTVNTNLKDRLDKVEETLKNILLLLLSSGKNPEESNYEIDLKSQYNDLIKKYNDLKDNSN